MLIKKAYQGEFKHLLSILRLAMLDNRAYVAFPKKKFDYSPVLKLLHDEGFVESYEDRKEIVIINLKQMYWKSFQSPVHPFSSLEGARINKRMTASSKQLLRQNLRQGQVPHLSISTDKGVMSSRSAASKKIGGIPLFYIY